MQVYQSAPIRTLFHKCSRCKKQRSNWKQLSCGQYDETYRWLCNECMKILSENKIILLALKNLRISMN